MLEAMRPAWLLPFVLASACSGDETVTTDTTGGTTSSPGTTTGTSSTTTVEPATGTSTTTTDPLTSTSTTDEPGSSSSGSGSTTGDPGPILPGECASNADCKLFEDCCECKGVPLDDASPICELECDQTRCDDLEIDNAVCRLGQCITERLDCDSSNVICLVQPPMCPEGLLPGVDGDCWSGECVPGQLCNVVPDCKHCPDEWMCVTDVANAPNNPRRCEPIPQDCNDDPGCECAGAVCQGSFSFCSDPGGNELHCECIAC